MKAICATLCLLLLLGTCACTNSGNDAQTSTGLTTTEKTTITLYVDYSKPYITDLMRTLVADLPQYKFDIQYLPQNASQSELSREFKHGEGPDVVFSAYLTPDMEGLETGLADLSAKSYCSQYKPAYLKDVEKNGKIYFLPFASIVDGIVYNKTLFDQNGWTLPTNYEEYIALCDKILAKGYGVEGDLLKSTTAGRTFLRNYMLDSGYKLSSYRWLTQFNAGKASIRDIDWTAALQDLSVACELRKKSNELHPLTNGVDSFNALTQLSDHRYAMLESSSLIANQTEDTSSRDQYRLMPFYGSNSDGGYLFSNGYIKFGASAAAMADPQKAEAIDTLFTYLSSEKGQALINKYTFNIIAPTEEGTPQTDGDFFADVQTELTEGRILEYDSMTNCNRMIDDCVLAYVNGAMTSDELLDTLEDTNEHGDGMDAVLATATDDFSRDNMEALLMEVLRERTGSDFSVLYKDVKSTHIGNYPIARRYLASNFYAGDITDLDLSCCIQAAHYEDFDPSYEPTSLIVYTMTGKQILNLLEYGKDLYIGGGLTMQYTWDADKNTYIATGFTADNGKAFDLDADYTVVSLSVIPMGEGSYTSMKDTGIAYYKTVKEWLVQQGTVSPTSLAAPVMQGSQ